MKRILSISAVLVLLVSFLACEDEAGFIRNTGENKLLLPDNAGSSPYFPYETGKTWEYEGIYSCTHDFPEGEFMPDDTTWSWETSTVTKVLCETELTGANPYAVWEVQSTYITYMEDTEDTTITTSYSRVEGDSAYFYEELSDSEPWYSWPAEPEIGDEWDIVMVSSNGDTSTTHYEVVADDADANGYADCLKIKTTPDMVDEFDTYDLYDYMAWDVGRVMTTHLSVLIFPMGPAGDLITTIDGEDLLVDTYVSGIKE